MVLNLSGLSPGPYLEPDLDESPTIVLAVLVGVVGGLVLVGLVAWAVFGASLGGSCLG